MVEASIGNVDHLRKPASLHYSCISSNSDLQSARPLKTVTSQEPPKAEGKCRIVDLRFGNVKLKAQALKENFCNAHLLTR